KLEGADGLRIHIDDADAVVIRIRHIEPVASEAEAARLVEHFRFQPAGGIAEEGRATAVLGVDELDLAIVRVGHIQLAALLGHAEGMLQAYFLADAVHVAKLEKPLADDSRDFALTTKRQRANRADLTIRHVQVRAVACQAAWLGE